MDWQLIFNAISDPAMILDKEHRILAANESTLTLTGMSSSELIGRYCYEVCHGLPIPPADCPLQTLLRLQEKQVCAKEIEISEKTYMITVTPLLSDDGEIEKILHISRDITSRKQAEAARIRLQTQLLEARKMETIITLAGGVAHDFNNALTSVIGNIELIKMDTTDHDVEEYATAVEESAYRMADLTRQLLAYARGGKYQEREIELQSFLEKAIDNSDYLIDENIELKKNLHCRESLIVVDSGQLQMVLDSIVKNAVEAIEGQGRVEILCEKRQLREDFACKLSSIVDEDYACITVKDNGCGMDRDTLEKIFEPFYTTKFAGRGLGMAAVYGIVKNHGGYIVVDSKPGTGTSVELYLPLKTQKISKNPEATAKATILLVEDEEVLQSVEKRLLEKLGYSVLLAGNGRQALQLAEKYEKTIDIALVDIYLPDINGDILSANLMKLCPALKIILCSATVPGWLTEKALAGGAQGFIKKPFALTELQEVLLKTINMD